MEAVLAVSAIYPSNLIGVKNEEELLRAVKEEAKIREERKKERLAKKEEKKAQKAAEREARIEKEAEEKFLKIRDKYVLNAFGITRKKLEELERERKSLQEAHENKIGDDPLLSSTNSLNITEGVYKGAVGVTKADRKSSSKSFAQGMVGVAGSAATLFAPEIIAKISLFTASLTAGPIFTVLGIIISAAVALRGFSKFLKRNKGNVSDEVAKGEDLEKKLEEYFAKIEAFSRSIDADKEMIKGKIKTLKRKELRAFLDNYFKEKSKSFGLELEDLKTGEVGEVYEEFKEDANEAEKQRQLEEKEKKGKQKKGGSEAEEPAVLGG